MKVCVKSCSDAGLDDPIEGSNVCETLKCEST